MTVPTHPSPPHPPSIRGLPILGIMPSFLRDPLPVTVDAWRRYGDVIRYHYVGPFWGVMLFHPDHVKRVLQDQNHNYPKPPIQMARFAEVVGNGLFTAEGPDWLQQRRTLQPAFHRQRIEAFAGIMTAEAEALAERWAPRARSGEWFDVLPDMRQLVMRIVARTLFGTQLGTEIDEIARSVLPLLEWTNRRLFLPIDPVGDLPLPPRRRFESHLATVDFHIRRFIDQRRASQEPHDDLLGMLLQARDPETGAGLSDIQLRDQVMTIFLAGTDTTVNLLGWTWYLLSRNVEAARRQRAELQSVLNGRAPLAEDLPQLRYTAIVVDETLRLYPPAWAMSRLAQVDDEVGGFRIQAGSNVLLSQWVTHRHPEFWENPEGFDPERFTPERSAGRPRFAYFPFGGGPRQCIGNTFAHMEAVLVIATLARRYSLELAPGAPLRPKAVIGLRPYPGVIVRARAID